MTSKNLSYKTLVRRNLSSRLWMFALTLFGCLSALLLPLFVIQQAYQREMEVCAQNIAHGITTGIPKEDILWSAQEGIYTILSFDNIAIKIILFVLACICGIAMFRYLHDRQQVDFFHAMPMNRKHLFVLNYVSGILSVLPLFLIVYLVAVGTAAAMGLGGLLTGGILLQNVLGHIFFFLLNYTLAVLCTVLTGNTIITILLAIWVQFSVPLFMMLYQIWQGTYYVTYAGVSSGQLAIMQGGSPVVKYCLSTPHVQDIDYLAEGVVTVGGMQALVYPVIGTLIFLALSYVLFVRRKSECAGTALAFPRIKAPLQGYMCLFMGTAFATLFHAMFSGEGGWKWFGLIFGVVLCHAVVEIICEFDFKAMLHHWKQMLVLCVVAVAVMLGMQNDVLGYDSYLPKESDITGVGLSSSADQRYYGYNDYQAFRRNSLLTDPESIHAVYEIAECIVSNGTEDVGIQPEDDYYTGIWIQYQLKNGKRVYRRYEIGIAMLEGKLDDLLTQEAYIKNYMELQHLNVPENAKDGDIELAVYNSMLPERTIDDVGLTEKPDEIRRILDSLKAEQIQNARAHMYEIPVLSMRVLDQREDRYDRMDEKDRFITTLDTIPIYPSDTKTLALIQEILDIAPVPPKAEVITEFQMNIHESHSDAASAAKDGVPYTMEDSEERIVIRDKAQIQELMQNVCMDNQVYLSGKYVKWDSFAEPYSVEMMVRYQYSDGTQASNYVSVRYPKGTTPIELLRKLTGKPLALQ